MQISESGFVTFTDSDSGVEIVTKVSNVVAFEQEDKKNEKVYGCRIIGLNDIVIRHTREEHEKLKEWILTS